MDPWFSSLPGAIEQIRAERDRLRRELAERDAVCQAHMELRYNAERERDEALVQVEYERDQRKLTVMAYDEELAEIKRVLIAFHRQEGDGIVSVKRLAKRLHDEQTAGGARLPAEIPADYPDGSFSPSGTFSTGEEVGP